MRHKISNNQLLYNPKIEITSQRNNNISRRHFKETSEVSSTIAESTANFLDYSYIRPSYQEEEVDIAGLGEGLRLLGNIQLSQGR